MNPQTYFEDLVSTFTSDESLPRIGIVPDGPAGPLPDTIPLYGLDGDGRPSLPQGTVSGEGFALALRVLPRMLYCNLCVRLQQEMGSMLESKTTDDTQVERASQPWEDTGDLDLASRPREGVHDLESSSSPTPQGTAANVQKDTLIPRTKIAISTIYDWIRGTASDNAARADTEDVTMDDIELKEREFYKSQRRERIARRLGMVNRLIAALLGGLSVIVPMLIVAINSSQVKTLVTSNVAVLLFSLGLAWKSTAKIETLLATRSLSWWSL
ncbi:MAG: hypothetical protein Q9199_000414 [Rusavskia elegans]